MCNMFFNYPVLSVVGVVLLLQCSFALPSAAVGQTVSGGVVLREIVQIPNVANAEILAVRHNGEILVTSTKTTSLFQVSPHKAKAPIQVAQIPNAIGLGGIAECGTRCPSMSLRHPTLTGNATAPGANSVWKVDMRQSRTLARGAVAQPAHVSLVATILDAQILNGMCRMGLNDTSNLLIADSAAGTVIKLDVNTAAYEIVIRDPTMANLPTGFVPPGFTPISVDGIHIHGSDLYYTSLNQGLFAKIPISLTTGVGTGPAEVLVDKIFGDDFVFSKDGKRAWIALNGQNTLAEVDIPGKTAKIIANSTFLSQDTAVAFGRTVRDRNSLYISGAGIFGSNSTVSASIVRADLPHGDTGR
ncbi:uncharacterized protein EAF02_005870 [Botrytis sinoallii]|uniref:uncharacterized protein n=1 Tax=Botrytis sinoallii TaxID=1463999 RepID=UPI00190086FD|nr:uncharacterized protein EAF02_005870 [Botrytis sinoallii]KAF7882507.1 hypothetical protein EAF02_005870 [Botrytis sinoallii]